MIGRNYITYIYQSLTFKASIWQMNEWFQKPLQSFDWSHCILVNIRFMGYMLHGIQKFTWKLITPRLRATWIFFNLFNFLKIISVIKKSVEAVLFVAFLYIYIMNPWLILSMCHTLYLRNPLTYDHETLHVYIVLSWYTQHIDKAIMCNKTGLM